MNARHAASLCNEKNTNQSGEGILQKKRLVLGYFDGFVFYATTIIHLRGTVNMRAPDQRARLKQARAERYRSWNRATTYLHCHLRGDGLRANL